MIRCGSQSVLCDLPISFDTYTGCSHACAYCFVKRKVDISEVKARASIAGLQRFVEGQRSGETSWCDWNIPLHWGGMSDPFQPCEQHYKISLRALEYLAETQYPFVVSTKGALVTEEPYISLLARCNAAVQISMICSKYDKLDKGAPTYDERLEMVRKLSKRVKRVIARVQPYMPEVKTDVLENIPRLAEAGAHGLTIEGMKFVRKVKGMERIGGDYCYPTRLLKADFEEIKHACHANGLRFYSAENRLRTMGDNMCCCGVGDMHGFKPNTYNATHILNGRKVEPTERMKEVGTAYCFKALNQTTAGQSRISKASFNYMMLEYVEKERKRG